MKVGELKQVLGILPQDFEVIQEVYECGQYSYPKVTGFSLTEQGEVVLINELDKPEGK